MKTIKIPLGAEVAVTLNEKALQHYELLEKDNSELLKRSINAEKKLADYKKNNIVFKAHESYRTEDLWTSHQNANLRGSVSSIAYTKTTMNEEIQIFLDEIKNLKKENRDLNTKLIELSGNVKKSSKCWWEK